LKVEKTFRALCFASTPGSFGTTFFFNTAEAFKQAVQAIADSLQPFDDSLQPFDDRRTCILCDQNIEHANCDMG
jgi:hypothetical protein